MTFNRRDFISSTAALALAAAASVLRAEDYPARPIKMVVPFPPGGALDTYVRAVLPELEKQLGQPVVPENIGGAGGGIGAASVARAKADGYTLMAAPIQTLSMNPALQPKLTYDPVKDFVAVFQTVTVNYILVVNPSLPFKTLPELIAYAKANPGRLSYATSGNGSAQHMAVALLESKAGIDLLQIPYKGMGPAITDLLGGQVQLAIADQPSLMQHIKAGKLRALAVAGRKRSRDLPELPTIAEAAQLPDYEAVAWQGIVAPAATPPAIVRRVNEAFAKVHATPAVAERLTALGFDLVGGTPESFRQFLEADIAKWKKVVRDNKIQPD
jgi:tripartite-type tricarboxylate transporter receptor subunit TctC